MGIAPGPDAAAAVAPAVQWVHATVDRVRAPLTFSNFRESATDPESLHGGSLGRLPAVRDRYARTDSCARTSPSAEVSSGPRLLTDF